MTLINLPLWQRGIEGDFPDLKSPLAPLFQRGGIIRLKTNRPFFVDVGALSAYASSGTSPGRGGPFGAGTLMTGRGAPLWAPEKAAAEGRPYRIFRLFHIDHLLSMLGAKRLYSYASLGVCLDSRLRVGLMIRIFFLVRNLLPDLSKVGQHQDNFSYALHIVLQIGLEQMAVHKEIEPL